MSGAILFLAHRLPFPPDRGDKIRSHHILRHLARHAEVHVGCLAEGRDLDHVGQLDAIAASHCVARRNLPLPMAGLLALARQEPISLTAFRSRKLANYVRDTIARHDIRAIYVFSGQMGQYVPADFAGRVIADLGDVDSAKFEAYTGKESWPFSWIYAREGRLMRIEEQRIAARADHTLFVSDAECALFRSRLEPGVSANLCSIANGIDAGAFDPRAVATHPALSPASGPHIVFTGQMDYPPNVAAAQRLVQRVMLLVRQHHPQALCHIVGRNPTVAVRNLEGQNGARIWGEVPDVRPFLAGGDLVVVPLEIARGVQNKVLEAMAMARPIVLTPGAATGISAKDQEHFAVGETDAELAVLVAALLSDQPRAAAMGDLARQFVIEHYGWDAMLAPLERLIHPGPEGSTRAAA